MVISRRKKKDVECMYVTIIVSPLFPSLIDGFSLKPQNTELKTIAKKAHRIIKLEYVN